MGALVYWYAIIAYKALSLPISISYTNIKISCGKNNFDTQPLPKESHYMHCMTCKIITHKGNIHRERELLIYLSSNNANCGNVCIRRVNAQETLYAGLSSHEGANAEKS